MVMKNQQYFTSVVSKLWTALCD